MLVRLWRSFRLAFLIVVFIGLGVFLVATTPWHRWFGAPADYEGERRAGQPLVEAIYRFRAETGLWPEYLDDLIPRYLPTAPAPTWFYTVTPEGPALSTALAERRTHVGYDFDPVEAHWRVFGEVENRVLPDVHRAVTTASTQGGMEKIDNELAELDRRIRREPTLLEHWRGKASVLRSVERSAEARAVAVAAREALPQSFWPPLALAAIDQTPPTFAAWAAAHPSFTHDYYLALLQRAEGSDTAALATLHAGLRQTVEVQTDDPDTLAFYLWDETRYALSQKDFTLVLALTDAWQRAAEAHQVSDRSDLPLRAAALLALRKPPEAAKALAAFPQLSRDHPPWARRVDALAAAIQRGDGSFVYDPGATPAPYSVFALPQ